MSDIYKDYGKYYDLIYSNKDYVEECNNIEEYIKSFSTIVVKNILDVGCGTGSHAIVLSKRGYQVVGIDPSEIMIDQAKAKGTSLPVEFHAQDVRRLRLEEVFDLVISMFGTFDYLIRDEDIQSALRAIRKHVDDGALFIFDFWPISAYSIRDRWRSVLEVSKERLKAIRIMDGLFDVKTNLASISIKCYIIENKTVIDSFVEEHKLRAFTIPEVTHFLLENRYKPIDFFKVDWAKKPSYTLDKADIKTTNIVCIARAS